MWHRPYVLLTLFGISLLAFAVRWYQIGESLWLDELHTAWCVEGSWQQVASRARLGNHSPLYFYLPWLTVQVFGASEISLRLPSLAAGMLLVPALGWWTAQGSKNLVAGLAVALLLAIDRHCIFYAQEARPYATLQLLAWVHAACVWRLSRQPTLPMRVFFITGAVVLIHLHYTAALFVAGELVYLASQCGGGHKDPRYSWKSLSLDTALVLLGWLPAASHILSVAALRQQWQRIPTDATFTGLVHLLRVDVYWLWPIAALGVTAIGRRFRHRVDAPAGDRRIILLLASVLVVPLFAAWLVTVAGEGNLFSRRYLWSSYAAVIVFGVYFWSLLPAPWMRGLVALAVLVASATDLVRQYTTDGRLLADRRQNWRAAVDWVNQQPVRGRQAAFLRSAFLEETWLQTRHDPILEAYCLAPIRTLYPVELEAYALATPDPARMRAETWRRVDKCDTVYFFVAGHSSVRGSFPQSLAAYLVRLDPKWRVTSTPTFGSLVVVQAQRDRPAVSSEE